MPGILDIAEKKAIDKIEFAYRTGKRTAKMNVDAYCEGLRNSLGVEPNRAVCDRWYQNATSRVAEDKWYAKTINAFKSGKWKRNYIRAMTGYGVSFAPQVSTPMPRGIVIE